eukprot:maker-scaffold1289_size50518-snap-gene-0.8 protein:Tk08061 transcript:maker-scaffold1289_size50518-snap-gene-0.8-mRNA-1 annotation:"argonaute 3 protein"
MEAWKAFHSSHGHNGSRNPVGNLLFNNTFVWHATTIWNGSKDLREAPNKGVAMKPVCGQNGKTFSNRCLADNNDVGRCGETTPAASDAGRPRGDVGGEEKLAKGFPRAIRPILAVEGSPRLHGHGMDRELIEAGQTCPLQKRRYLSPKHNMNGSRPMGKGRAGLLLQKLKMKLEEESQANDQSSTTAELVPPQPSETFSDVEPQSSSGPSDAKEEKRRELRKKLSEMRKNAARDQSYGQHIIQEAEPIQETHAPRQSVAVPVFESSDSAISTQSDSPSPTSGSLEEIEFVKEDLTPSMNKLNLRTHNCSPSARLPEPPNVPHEKPGIKSTQPRPSNSVWRDIPLEVNYLDLKVVEGKGFFEYYVEFKPRIDAKKHSYALMRQLESNLGRVRNYDGVGNLCLPYRLEQEVSVFKTNHPDPESSIKHVEVVIKFLKEAGYGDKRAIFWYNILFKRIMRTLKMVQMNRNYFNPTAQITMKDLNMEIWPGYVLSVEEYDGGLKLCCDTAFRVLRKDRAYDILEEIYLSMKDKRLKEDPKTAIAKALLGQTVLTRYNNNTYRIDDIDFSATPRSEFPMVRRGQEAPENVSYLDYYKDQYSVRIQYPDQPMLVSRPKKRDAEQPGQLIMLVPELCYMTGISDSIRKNFHMMKAITNAMNSTPASRHMALQKFVSSIRQSEEASQILADWGLAMSSAALCVNGRQIRSVKLLFGNRGEAADVVDDFDHQLKGAKMIQGARLKRWIVIAEDKNMREVKVLGDCFMKHARRLDMQVSDPIIRTMSVLRPTEIIKIINGEHKPNSELELVFVLAPSKRSDLYAAVKKECLVRHGIPSQFALVATIAHERKREGVVQKLTMQINAKLGGENWGLRSPFSNTMIIGIDVYHSPDHHQSWSGFVASLNQPCTCWFSDSIEQGQDTEIMNQISKLFDKALKAYRNKNNRFPDKIIVFRDGVGDSRLEITKTFEIDAMKRSIQAFGANIGITFVVVSKRINTRLLLRNRDKLDNPPPGTVLDHTITKKAFISHEVGSNTGNVEYPNFFLVSQKVRQGTVCPTHYIILQNDLGLEAEKVQRLSYMLTFMYYNWTGPVRVPAPCLYAHKVAYLSGEYLKRAANPNQLEKLYYL